MHSRTSEFAGRARRTRRNGRFAVIDHFTFHTRSNESFLARARVFTRTSAYAESVFVARISGAVIDLNARFAVTRKSFFAGAFVWHRTHSTRFTVGVDMTRRAFA